MIDKNNNNIKKGDIVFFSLNLWMYKGIVVGLNKENETCSIEVLEDETGVGRIERLNLIECNRYLTIMNSNQ